MCESTGIPDSQQPTGSQMYINSYRKIPKISPKVYIFQRPCLRGLFWRGLSTEGNLRFEIDWASLIVGSKFTVFALFYFVFEGNFPSTSPRGAYIWRGHLTERLLRYRLGGGAYLWRGLYMERLIFRILSYIFKYTYLIKSCVFVAFLLYFLTVLSILR